MVNVPQVAISDVYSVLGFFVCIGKSTGKLSIRDVGKVGFEGRV